MKRFNSISVQYQWLIAFICATVLLFLLFWWVRLVSEHKIFALLIFVFVPLIQFLITPLFTKLNFYTYYSPMVVSFGSNRNVIDLHNGTSFDYMMDMRRVQSGMAWKKTMLKHYLNALLNIIEQIEYGTLSPGIIVRGSSYFISERSAKKLGFTVYQTSFPEKLNITLNYLDLIWMYSLSNGKLIFPNLFQTKTIRISGASLLEKRNTILNIIRFLD